MAKPNLVRAPSGERVPLILSSEGDLPVVQVPGVINQYLRDYQRDGVRFMYDHYKEDSGAILADDMGLGKTVQVIALLAALLGKTGQAKDQEKFRPEFIRKMEDSLDEQHAVTDNENLRQDPLHPFLIIGPASVLYNWLDEFETWGYFKIGKFHKQYKKQTIADLRNHKLEIVITTYETCRDNIDDFMSVEWNAIFADEVHRIKGASSELTLALKKLPCRRKFGLTGTPLQNRLNELWCIMDWANPACFGDFKSFNKKYVLMIERGQKLDVTKRQRAEARKAQQDLLKAYNRYLLRRTKDLIADQLPRKDDLVVYCRPTDLQTEIYRAILDEGDMKYVLMQKQKCSCGSGKANMQCHYKNSPDGVPVRSLTMTFMHLLLKAANHVALLMPGVSSSGRQQSYADDVCRRVFDRHKYLSELGHTTAFRTLSDPKCCGKMKVLVDLLTIFKKQKSKVLLFSYSTKLLDVLEAYIMSLGYEYRRLDGSTPSETRLTLVQQFNREPSIFIFLISTKAGGIGLSLTGANVVVIFDPNWNPAHDLQAQDRAYRIGQRRDVRVYRLISAGTIEENIYLRQVFKQQIGSVALEKKNARRLFCGTVKSDELSGVENLFQLRTGDKCLTENILNRNEKIEAELKGFEIGTYVQNTNKAKKDELTDSSAESDDEAKSFDGYMSSETTSDQSEADNERTADDDSSSLSETDEQKSSLSHSSVEMDGEENLLESKMASSSALASLQSVSDVLGGNDVIHMHRNKKLIRGGRVEDHITNCAVIDVYELHQNSQMPAAKCQPLEYSSSEDSEADDIPSKSRKPTKSSKPVQPQRSVSSRNNTSSRIVGKSHVLIGRTPVAIRRKQFEQLASHFGTKNPRELAKLILKSSSKEREQMLKEFYTTSHPQLKPIFEELESKSKNKKQMIHSKIRPVERPQIVQRKEHRKSDAQSEEKKVAVEQKDLPLPKKEENFTCLKCPTELKAAKSMKSSKRHLQSVEEPTMKKVGVDILDTFLTDSCSNQKRPLAHYQRRKPRTADINEGKKSSQSSTFSSNAIIDEFLEIGTSEKCSANKRRTETCAVPVQSSKRGRIGKESSQTKHHSLLDEIL